MKNFVNVIGRIGFTPELIPSNNPNNPDACRASTVILVNPPKQRTASGQIVELPPVPFYITRWGNAARRLVENFSTGDLVEALGSLEENTFKVDIPNGAPATVSSPQLKVTNLTHLPYTQDNEASVHLTGNLCDNPVLRYPHNDVKKERPFATFRLAVTTQYQDSTSKKWIDQTVFVSCLVNGDAALNLVKYCSKGSTIRVKGTITDYKYTPAGAEKSYTILQTQVDSRGLKFLRWANSGASAASDGAAGGDDPAQPGRQLPPSREFAGAAHSAKPHTTENLDEDVPF